ncbi:MAG: divalent metal cation transporter [Acidobacteria bacterium]|nr:divalent metal cation transporter [Acidobacteriota bacterium]
MMPRRAWDSKTLKIKMRSMTIHAAWASSANRIARRAIRYLILDEVDKYPPFAGKEAEPIQLVLKRTETFGHRALALLGCTPTTRTGNIWRWWDSCGVRKFFHVPCPECGEYQKLSWSQMKWPARGERSYLEYADVVERDDLGEYECERCEARWNNRQKPAIVEKGVGQKQYAESRVEVIVGCLVMVGVTFFIIVSCAATIHTSGRQDIVDAADAAIALRPLAGDYASLLFAFGLFNASVFAATILPLATAYTVCEGLGFEAGVNKKFREAPVFYWLYTLLIVVGGGLILIPGIPLILVSYLSQVANGFLLPFVLVFLLLLVNRVDLMGEFKNSRGYNLIAGATVAVLVVLTLLLLGLEIF